MAKEVALDTSMGTITLELYTHHAPKTCTNFLTLAARGYYDATPWHRVIAGFMLQGGDPTGTGRGGASIYGGGAPFADEIPLLPAPPPGAAAGGAGPAPTPALKHTGAGVLSMANAGPDTNGSQFFITLAPAPWLDGKHAVFGRVSRGMGVVRRLGLVKTDAEDRPVERVEIIRARVLDGGGEEEEEAAG